VVTINGLGNILSRYGLIGFTIFTFIVIYSGSWLINKYNAKGKIIFPLVIFVIGFSFGIIETPIIFSFIMSGYYLREKHHKNNINKI
jgi:predicted membrane protein